MPVMKIGLLYLEQFHMYTIYWASSFSKSKHLPFSYAVCTSHPSLNPNMPKMLNNLDKDEESIDESENFPYPSLNW